VGGKDVPRAAKRKKIKGEGRCVFLFIDLLREKGEGEIAAILRGGGLRGKKERFNGENFTLTGWGKKNSIAISRKSSKGSRV